MFPSKVGRKMCDVYENTIIPKEIGNVSRSRARGTSEIPHWPMQARQYATIMRLISTCATVHQNESVETD